MLNIDYHSFGSSWMDGKEQIQSFLWGTLKTNASILDVGAGGGTYRQLLGPNYDWSAVEIWSPAAEFLKTLYNTVYETDIRNFEYTKDYDIIIFGDVIEHLSVEDAQKVIEEAKKHSLRILIGVPYNLAQEPIYGNQAEKHLQPDLTDDIFNQRYSGFTRICSTQRYGYYYWEKTEEKKITVCLCATRNMYPQLQVMVSMLAETQPALKRIYAFVEDDLQSNNLITFINIKNFSKIIENQINNGGHWSYMSMTRCYFSELLPQEDKIIYLDLDIMIEKDISELWDMDMQNYEVAGVVDRYIGNFNIPYITKPATYINSGSIVMNLKQIRENHTDKKINDLLHAMKLVMPDQDAINLTCKILHIDCKWNSSDATTISSEPVINHVIRCKPWDPNSKWFPKWVEYYSKSGMALSRVPI